MRMCDRRILPSLVLLLGIQALPWLAQAASFDCAKAATKVEKTICANPELSKLDEQLHDAYQELLAQASDKEQIKSLQRQWLKKSRNVCQDAACLSARYHTRLAELTALTTAQAESTNDAAQAASQPSQRYHFTLTKGKGVAVCEAYLKRLNTADYSTTPPYCDIPEKTSVPGFTPLKRVPLTVEEVHTLYERINLFMQTGKQGSKEEDEAYDEKLKTLGQLPHIDSITSMKRLLQYGDIKVWRYDPSIDIDNDGIPDNIVVWQGIPVNTFLGICGNTTSLGPNARLFDRQYQGAFVVVAGNDRLDVTKTRAIFGHPSGGYRLPNGMLSTKFRPIGNAIGVFAYRDRYYFETFFDSTWGDFDNKRANDPDLENVLAVYLRQHEKSKQVCEYHMTQTE